MNLAEEWLESLRTFKLTVPTAGILIYTYVTQQI